MDRRPGRRFAVLDAKLLESWPAQVQGDLDYRDEPETLDCAACRLRFRVEDGIPIMLLDEAETLDGNGEGA